MEFNRKSYFALLSAFVFVFAGAFFLALSKGTTAMEETPANDNFDDLNFYRCVVETFNTTNGTSLSYTTSLSDDELNTITRMDCNSSGRDDSEKIVSVKGIEKLQSLTDFNISSNKLTSIDLSKNPNIEKLDIHDNLFSEDVYVYKGSTASIGSNIRLSSKIAWEKPTWESVDSNIAVVSEGGIVTGVSLGDVTIHGEVTDQYTTESNVHVVSITSDTYQINEEDRYIIIPNKIDESTIREHFTVGAELSIDIDLTNYNLYVKHGNTVIKTFQIVNYASDKYDMNRNYVYTGNSNLVLDDIATFNCTKEINGDTLVIKHNDSIIKESLLLSVSFGSLSVFNKVIALDDAIDYNTFIANISMSEGISYLLLDGDLEVTSGTISNGMRMKVYYDGEEIDNYTIQVGEVVDAYQLEFDSSLAVDQNKKYINYISTGTTVSELKNLVKVTGDNTRVEIYTNSKHETISANDNFIGSGDALVVYSGEKIVDEYAISVLGDANGDGYFNQIDLVQMRKHMAGWVNPLTNVVFEKTGIYSYAIDMDKNGTINQIDLVRMRKRIAGVE